MSDLERGDLPEEIPPLSRPPSYRSPSASLPLSLVVEPIETCDYNELS